MKKVENNEDFMQKFIHKMMEIYEEGNNLDRVIRTFVDIYWGFRCCLTPIEAKAFDRRFNKNRIKRIYGTHL